MFFSNWCHVELVRNGVALMCVTILLQVLLTIRFVTGFDNSSFNATELVFKCCQEWDEVDCLVHW